MGNLLPLPRRGLERGAYRVWVWAVTMPLLGLSLVYLLAGGPEPAPADGALAADPDTQAPLPDGPAPFVGTGPGRPENALAGRTGPEGGPPTTTGTTSSSTTTTTTTTSSSPTPGPIPPTDAVDQACQLLGANCKG